jgi:hypothetical protein
MKQRKAWSNGKEWTTLPEKRPKPDVDIVTYDDISGAEHIIFAIVSVIVGVVLALVIVTMSAAPEPVVLSVHSVTISVECQPPGCRAALTINLPD